MSASTAFERLMGSVDSCPWGATTGRHVKLTQEGRVAPEGRVARPLYSPEEKRRRDDSPWTIVQGVLAPAQFAVFLVSLGLVLHVLATGTGQAAANASVIIKTLTLYGIMTTGAIWEKAIFGRYLFARAFFWEDAMSMIVIALHTAYLVAALSGALDGRRLMLLALVAYASYLINAGQFVLKLRAARLAESDPWHRAAAGMRQA